MKKVLALTILTINLSAYSKDIDLKYAIDNAIKTNEEIKKTIYNKEYASAMLKEVENSRFGKLSLKATYTDGDEPVYSFAETIRQGKFSMASMATINNPPSISNTELSIEAGIPLFTAYKISNYKKIALSAIDGSDYYYKRVTNAIKFKTIYQYLTVMFYKDLINSIDKTIESSKEELENARKLKESGMVLGSDYYAALSIYSTMNKMRSDFESSYKNELKKLKILIGEESDELNIKGSFNLPNYEINDLKYLLDYAKSNRYDLKSYEKQKNMEEINKDIEKKSILPTVEAFGIFYGNTGAIDNLRTSSLYGLRVNFPVGDPTYFSRIEKAKAKEKIANENINQLLKDIETDILTSYENYNNSVKDIELSKNIISEGEKSLELFRPLYRQGKQSILEVIRAELNLFQARAMYIESLFKSHLYYSQLKFNSEQLDETFISNLASNIGEK